VTSRIGEIVVDCVDPQRLAAFWAGALGYREFARDDTGVAITGAGNAPTILFLRVPEAKTGKLRMHFDLCPTDVDQAAELDRLLGLGARRSERVVAGGSWVVLEDPEGNEFCLTRTRIRPEPADFHTGGRALPPD
jgi:catechol 2,3-dioxygenase-like lactoylglutathione lyase family enzyme